MKSSLTVSLSFQQNKNDGLDKRTCIYLHVVATVPSSKIIVFESKIIHVSLHICPHSYDSSRNTDFR